MPIYEYRCRGCGHTLEKIQKLGDAPLTRCPSCGKRLEKIYSVAAFQLKGGGWYSDGYSRKDGGAKSGGSEGTAGDGTKDSKDSKESKESKESKQDPKATKAEPKKAAAGGCGSGSCG